MQQQSTLNDVLHIKTRSRDHHNTYNTTITYLFSWDVYIVGVYFEIPPVHDKAPADTIIQFRNARDMYVQTCVICVPTTYGYALHVNAPRRESVLTTRRPREQYYVLQTDVS
jgi:hypothetical protein